jgi:uncharacterized protein (DUF2147 family)
MASVFLRSLFLVIFVIGGTIALHAPAGAAPDSNAMTPIGVWLFPNQRFAVSIDRCGDQLCGKIAWLKAPCDGHGLPRVDSENADPTLRSRPILGLTVMTGLRQTADGDWEDGAIYNPDDGSHYLALLSMNEDGSLRIRAYVGTPVLGKTLVLTRMAENASPILPNPVL